MKINKIIFLSHWAIIVLFLLSLTIVGFTFKNKEDYSRRIGESSLEKKSIALNTFQHIYIESGCRVNISGSSESKLLYSNIKTKKEVKPLYEVRNDTLFISSSKTNLGEWIDIHTNNLQSITSIGSQINIYNLNDDELTINGDHARFNISNNSSISFANIILKNNSDLQGWNYKGNALKLDIKASKVQFSSENHKLDRIDGSVSSNSTVRLPKTRIIDVESDNSSEIKMY